MTHRFTLIFLAFALQMACSSDNDSANTEAPFSQNFSEETGLLELSGATAKQIRLANNLKVTLLSSPTSNKSAMSVAVKVGSDDNPKDAQGLAHYLEHLLFLGTEIFPDVDGYKQFLAQNGGGSNAYTARNHTNYYFTVNKEAFDEAAHRMSRFFVNPLFDENYVEIQKNAIENEFNFRFEDFKPGRVIRAFYKEDLSSRLFAVGNMATIEQIPVQVTKDFFEEHYYAEAMHAVLAGPQTLEELEGLAQKYLSDIKSNPEKPLNRHDQELVFDQSKLPAEVFIKPADDVTNELTIIVPTKSVLKNKSLLSGISQLIGDESEDSLMHYLQQEGLIKLGANRLSGFLSSESLYLSVELSEKGVQNKRQVLNYMYGYIQFLKSQPMPDYLNQEVVSTERVGAMKKLFFSVDGQTVQNINGDYFSDDQLPKDVEELLLGGKSKSFNEIQYKAYLESINWEKFLVLNTDPAFTDYEIDFEPLENIEIGGLKLIEQDGIKLVTDSIYDFAYRYKNSNPESVMQAQGSFTLKKANRYFPEDETVYTDQDLTPYQYVPGEWGRVFYTPLPQSESLISYLTLDIYSSGVDLNYPMDVAGLFLFRELIRDQVAYGSYAMTQAGYNFGHGISILEGSMSFEFSGWSDKFLTALSDYLSFTDINIDSEGFENIKEKYKDVILVGRATDPSAFATRESYSKMTNMYLSFDDLLTALDSMTHSDFVDFTERYTQGLYFNGALSGNVKKDFIDEVAAVFKDQWSVDAWSETKDFTPASLPVASFSTDRVSQSIEGPSSRITNYVGLWNLGPVSIYKEKKLLEIFGQWLAPDYFNELRTNQGLAYSLGAGTFDFDNQGVISYSLTSSSHSANETGQRATDYIRLWTEEVLPAKPEALLETTLASLKARSLDFPASPPQAHAKYLGISRDEYLSLDEYIQSANTYDEILFDDVVNFGVERVLNQPQVGVFTEVEKKN